MVDVLIDNISLSHAISMTPLRREILSILIANNGCMKAYDVLSELSKIRLDTKPITVYRVLNFLVGKSILHKVSAKNSFVICNDVLDATHKKHVVFLSCKDCDQIQEINDQDFINNVQKFYAKQHFTMPAESVEMSGYCSKCIDSRSLG